jgi:hypothetical protein
MASNGTLLYFVIDSSHLAKIIVGVPCKKRSDHGPMVEKRTYLIPRKRELIFRDAKLVVTFNKYCERDMD